VFTNSSAISNTRGQPSYVDPYSITQEEEKNYNGEGEKDIEMNFTDTR
jgi:hypothetical protein